MRLALLKAHYRSELSWSEELLKESKAQLDSWYRLEIEINDLFIEHNLKYDAQVSLSFDDVMELFFDDIDTPNVISKLSSFFKGRRNIADVIDFKNYRISYPNNDRNLDSVTIALTNLRTNPKMTIETVKSFSNKENLSQFLSLLLNTTIGTAKVLGLMEKSADDWFKGNASDDDQAEFDAIAKRREDARARKDWAAADAARDEAKEKGIVLEDGPNGTTWRKA